MQGHPSGCHWLVKLPRLAPFPPTEPQPHLDGPNVPLKVLQLGLHLGHPLIKFFNLLRKASRQTGGIMQRKVCGSSAGKQVSLGEQLQSGCTAQ